MKGFNIGAAALIVGCLAAAPAQAWDRGKVDVLAVLPDVTPGVQSSVEGLTVGPDGNIYVPTFGFNTHGALTGNAVLYVFNPKGGLVRQVTIAGSSPHMLGLAFNPVNNFLLVLDFGAGTVLNVNPTTGTSSVFMGPIAGSGLNALTFDKAGNVYVSDSFNGVIWKAGPTGGTPVAWSSDPLLGPGIGLTPPFGANGVAFNNAGNVVYVANTAFHQIIQIPVNPDGSAGSASIFITGINAPDGIVVDTQDNLWICANQEDEIVIVDKAGKVIAKTWRLRRHRQKRCGERAAISGEPGPQPGPQDALCLKLGSEPAVCGRPGSNRLGVDASGTALQRVRDFRQDTEAPLATTLGEPPRPGWQG
jgi:sugar lactone lactonase YvrE